MTSKSNIAHANNTTVIKLDGEYEKYKKIYKKDFGKTNQNSLFWFLDLPHINNLMSG